LEMCAQMPDDLGLSLESMTLPVRTLLAVALDERAFAFEHEVGETALLERGNGLGLQQRRLLVPRIERGERAISGGRVLPTLLLALKLAERQVHDVRIRALSYPLERFVRRSRPVDVREADREHAQRVVDELLVGTAQRGKPPGGIGVGLGAELQIEQPEERALRVAMALLPEERPAVLVECLKMEGRARTALEHPAVGRF